jgi:hypothetical protein
MKEAGSRNNKEQAMKQCKKKRKFGEDAPFRGLTISPPPDAQLPFFLVGHKMHRRVRMPDLMDIQTKRKKGKKKVNIMKTISAIGSSKRIQTYASCFNIQQPYIPINDDQQTQQPYISINDDQHTTFRPYNRPNITLTIN